MIANALADKPLPVYGEGLNIRDWLYVEDHCKAIDLIIHKGRVGEVYNVGYKTEVLPVTTAEYGLSKAARPFNSRLDKSKLVEAGFTPLPTWQDALSRYLKEIEQSKKFFLLS